MPFSLLKKINKVQLWIVCVCFVVVYLLVRCYFFPPTVEMYLQGNTKTKKIPRLQIKKLRTGDLLFFSGNTKGERVCRSFGGSPFSHVSFVFVENEVRYLLECDIGTGCRPGGRVITVENKLTRSKGNYHRIVGVLKLLSTRPRYQQVVSILDEYTKIYFDDMMDKYFLADTPLQYTTPKIMFCSEFVASILQTLGLLRFDRIPAWYTPKRLYSEMSLRPGVVYSELTFLRCE